MKSLHRTAPRVLAALVSVTFLPGCAVRSMDRILHAIERKSEESQLLQTRPHVYGRIPVVFVHGTASSDERWGAMVKALDADPRIRERFEPWLFAYDSIAPPLYTANLLRRALTQAVDRLDPSASDSGLREMVVVGHSQGGLLAKMTAVRSEAHFLEGPPNNTKAERNLSDTERERLSEVLRVEPLPFVRSLVFICTPHRGSFLAASDSMRGIGVQLISMPARVMRWSTGVLAPEMDANTFWFVRALHSVENMSPNSTFVRELSMLNVAPGVAVHSIVAVSGRRLRTDSDDGVVRYSSAHLENVESELLVRSDHSSLERPAIIEEVHRILLEYAADSQGRVGSCAATSARSRVAPNRAPFGSVAVTSAEAPHD